MSRPTLLIPVVFPDPDPYPMADPYLEGLTGFDIVLFGYWEIPERTTPQAARDTHETEAEAVLYEMAAQFSRAGASTDIQLHFGPAGARKSDLQDRIIAETDADGVLIPEHIELVSNVLVPLRDDRKRDRIVDFVSAFDAETTFVLELYHAAPSEAAIDPAERMLAAVREKLLDRGFEDDDVAVTVEVTDDPQEAIADRARNHNIVVMGETEELDEADHFFGPVYEYINRETNTPIVVVLA